MGMRKSAPKLNAATGKRLGQYNSNKTVFTLFFKKKKLMKYIKLRMILKWVGTRLNG